MSHLTLTVTQTERTYKPIVALSFRELPKLRGGQRRVEKRRRKYDVYLAKHVPVSREGMAARPPLPRFKLSDLKQFKSDAFVAIDGYVYNMTGFVFAEAEDDR